ncbi:MAG TPA: PAS domain S-box protein [Terriglobales bacterium]|jgi:PAS domain S-box-containing protein
MNHPDSERWGFTHLLQHWAVRSAGALFATALALFIWTLWPVMHEDPFAIFIAAVIVVARFFGFGPALICTVASACVLAYWVFPPTGFLVTHNDAERLVVFGVVSILTAGLARQRSRAETREGDMRQMMASIVESSNDAILSVSYGGIVTSWNRGAETLYGYTAEEAIGQHISLIAPPERIQEISQNTIRLQRGEHIESYHTERMRKDGRRVSVMLSISPLRKSKGMVIGSSVIARDITAQKRAEEALRRNEKLATAGRLAATIAHEINNPLEAVINLLYLAQQSPERSHEYLKQAEQEVQRVAVIAHQTLGFVREHASPKPLNVTETIAQILHLYSRRLQQKHIRVLERFDKDAEVWGFAGELRQLFSNLTLNAIDAVKDGGTLQLRVSRRHEWGNPSRRGVRILIADNGSGIARGDMQHIFEPFFTTKKDVGTGLGLWLAHGVVQKHAGSIRVRSRTVPGKNGTVFSVFLPSKPKETVPELRKSIPDQSLTHDRPSVQ